MITVLFKGIPTNLFYDPLVCDNLSHDYYTDKCIFMITAPYNQINYKYISRRCILVIPKQMRWFG